jgi:uncharacterized membrane protein YccF (DUF307 family)
MDPLTIVFQLFALGAFLVFLAFGLATLVLMIHLTSMPEGRRARRAEAQARASFTD